MTTAHEVNPAPPDRPQRGRSANQLPRGKHGLPRTFVARNQRERLMAAVVECCALIGYQTMSVEDIICHAGVSRRTFYVNFRSKADAFASAYREMAERLLEAEERAARKYPPSPEAVIAAMRAYLETLQAQPVLARACLIDIVTSGVDGVRQRNEVHRRFAEAIQAHIPQDQLEGAPLPMLAELVVGGIYELVAARVLEEGGENLDALLPDLAYVAVAPFFGHAVAVEHRDRLRAEQAAGGPPLAKGAGRRPHT